MMRAGKTLYEVLGVTQQADADTIRKAWRAAVMRAHPDHGGSADEVIEIQAANEVLSNPARRAAYDLNLTTPTDGAVADNALAEDLARVFQDLAEEVARVVAEALAAAMAAAARANDTPDHRSADAMDWVSHLHDISEILCSATTKQGYPCKRNRQGGGLYCWTHAQHGSGAGKTGPLVQQCRARTKAGRPCHGSAMDNGYCYQHGGRRRSSSQKGLRSSARQSLVVHQTGNRPDVAISTSTFSSKPEAIGCSLFLLAAMVGTPLTIWWIASDFDIPQRAEISMAVSWVIAWLSTKVMDF